MRPLVILVALAALPPLLWAKSLAQAPQFRAGTSLVPVDVRVLGRDGKPITTLSRDDFTVFENGVRQDISHFAARALTPDASSTLQTTGLTLRTTASDPLTLENRRVFVLLLGNGRLQPPARGLDAALKFVRTQLLPQDLVAVLAYNRATDFTTDHDRIASVLDRFRQANDRIDHEMKQWFTGLRAIYGSRDLPVSIQHDVDQVFGPAGSRDVHTPVGVVAGATRVAQDQRATIDALQTADRVNSSADPALLAQTNAFDLAAADLTGMSLDAYASLTVSSNQDLQTLYAGIGYLRYVEGEKHLVYFTENGLSLPRTEDDDNLVAVASDARVVVDVVRTGGVDIGMDLGLATPATAPSAGRGRAGGGRATFATPAPVAPWATQTLQTFAQATGGVLSLGRADIGLDRVDASTRFSYLLGYYPADARLDGKFRRITVSVSRPDVQVFYRHGYYASAQVAQLDRQQVVTYTRIAAAKSYGPDIKDIGLTLDAVRPAEGAGQSVDISLHVDASQLALPLRNGKHTGRMTVALFCADRQQRPVGELWRAVDFDLSEETYQRFLKDGVPVEAHLPADGVAVFVKAVVYDFGADRVGSVAAKVR